MVIATIASIIMLFFIGAFIYPKIYLIFSKNKRQFIKEIEHQYHQSIEIIQDNSTRKGNGTLILKTKKEPKVEFHAAKNVYDEYKIDYEEYAFLYFLENSGDSVFDGIAVEKGSDTFYDYPDMQFIKCEVYLPIDSYAQIEQASNQLWNLQKWMKKKVKTFSLPIHLKIGDYISSVAYTDELKEEDAVFQEKYQYYWYLKNNQKDMSMIPDSDKREIIYSDVMYNTQEQAYEVSNCEFFVNFEKQRNCEENGIIAI